MLDDAATGRTPVLNANFGWNEDQARVRRGGAGCVWEPTTISSVTGMLETIGPKAAISSCLADMIAARRLMALRWGTMESHSAAEYI